MAKVIDSTGFSYKEINPVPEAAQKPKMAFFADISILASCKA